MIYNLKIFVILFLLISQYRGLSAESLFEINSKDIKLDIKNDYYICKVKLKDPISNQVKNKEFCELVSQSLKETEIKLRNMSSNKKEVIYSFFSEKEERVYPVLHTEKQNFKVQTIIFNIKEKLYKFELIDSNGNYFYLSKDLDYIKVRQL